jgi:hypothetical protein
MSTKDPVVGAAMLSNLSLPCPIYVSGLERMVSARSLVRQTLHPPIKMVVTVMSRFVTLGMSVTLTIA